MRKSISAAAFILLALASRHATLKGAPATRHVRFLHIAETHAQLETHWEYLPEDPKHMHRMGGFARIRTALDQERTSAPGRCSRSTVATRFKVRLWPRGLMEKPLSLR
jgi:2',3'-cyclic-nucleotide 2'-phosphodiesterase (5'-nucleotidase family)